MKLPITENPTLEQVWAVKRTTVFFARLFWFTPVILFPIIALISASWTPLIAIPIYFTGAIFRSLKALLILIAIVVAGYIWYTRPVLNLGFIFFVIIAFFGHQTFHSLMKWKMILDKTEENFNSNAGQAIKEIIEKHTSEKG